MLSLFFYLILLLILGAIIWLWWYQRKYREEHSTSSSTQRSAALASASTSATQSIPPSTAATPQYDPKLIVLQIKAFPGKPFMGYELLQTLLALELRYGERNIFHRHNSDNDSTIMFSIAAATPTGTFPIDDMGGFKCSGLILFMPLRAKQKLMARFNLMLDIARQLAEELGGEIYDEWHQPINPVVLRRLREKICLVDNNSLYTADLLDNLD